MNLILRSILYGIGLLMSCPIHAGVSATDTIMPVINFSKPAVSFNGAETHYQFNYRSNIDTPYTESAIVQHMLTGQARFTIAGKLPLTVGYLIRKSNSAYFRDIYNIRAEFDRPAFRERLHSAFKQQLLAKLYQYKDSLTEKLYGLKLTEWEKLKSWLDNPLTVQQLIEMNEVYRIPQLSYDAALPDSLAKPRSDSIRAKAKEFIDLYNAQQQKLQLLTGTKDSLKRAYDQAVSKFNSLKQLIENPAADAKELELQLARYAGASIPVPRAYSRLLNITEAGLGRNAVNKSELTAKNISVNGINFEYNSWYYFSVTAGLVDYRFRDFVIREDRKPRQYMYLLRLGAGRKERNYFIVSWFHGRKQLFGGGTYQPLTITGLTAETKLQLSANSYIVAEAGQSLSRDLHLAPPDQSKAWDLSNKTNKAISLRWSGYFPATQTRIEAQYKYTGANYQSFSYFQPSSALTAWYFKADQTFFRRQLKISVSARSNDFSNPYIQQRYSSNAVFKSINISYRKRYWPTVTIGYMPSSQITKLGNQLVENRFQSLTGSFNHFYKLGTLRSASTVIYTKFYNKAPDSGFVFFNAISLYYSQQFFFKDFTIHAGISQTRNADYDYKVMDNNVQFRFMKRGSFSAGVKINNFNKEFTRPTAYSSLQVPVGKRDIISVGIDQGYLPGRSKDIIRNDFYNLGFSKYFR